MQFSQSPSFDEVQSSRVQENDFNWKAGPSKLELFIRANFYILTTVLY